MQAQQTVATVLHEHGLRTEPAYRVLDLASEAGELAKDGNESTDYGGDPRAASVNEDELGDALFCVLALAEETGIDAESALEAALGKYQERLAASDGPGSGGA